MMNAARYAVGVQGIAIAERAYQKAVGYAKDRVQSRPVDGSMSAAAPIIHHPDVKRMLMTMRAITEGCRAMASVAAAAYDAAHHHPDAEVRKENAAFYEFLVPLVKGYSTEMSLEVTSLGVQVHGGMGFIEETGAAQYYRDAKILTIYEGTTAIQANDLVGTQDGARRRCRRQGDRRTDRKDRGRAGGARQRQRAGRGQAADGGAPGLCGRGRVHRRQHPQQPQRRLCRQRALPDAGGQPDGGLAAGARAAGGRGPAGRGHRCGLHAEPRSPPRVSTPTTSSAAPRACATRSWKVQRPSRHWLPKRSELSCKRFGVLSPHRHGRAGPASRIQRTPFRRPHDRTRAHPAPGSARTSSSR